MSFGSETGRARSGTKGVSGKAKKSQKRRKQEYHSHKRSHFQESQLLTEGEVRDRTIIALDRLGHQVLSNEPGGYDLADWLRSLNSLLEDFKEKLGTENIPEDFGTRVQAALSSVTVPTSASQTDPEIERLAEEEADARGALAEIERRSEEKLASLKNDRDACAKELKLEREKLAKTKEERESRGFFARLTKSGPSTGQTEARIAELSSKLSKLEDEIRSHQNSRSENARKTDAAEVAAQEKLGEITSKLSELQRARQSRLQLSREREVAAKQIAELVSSLRLDVVSSTSDGSQT